MGERNGPPELGGSGQQESNGRSSTQMAVDQIQTQLQETSTALKLTPRQAVLWDAYQERISALMADLMRIEPYSAHLGSAPQQIEKKAASVRNRLAAMEDIVDASKQLYEALDPEQKKIADQRLAATVPPLYVGFGGSGTSASGSSNNRRPGNGQSGPGGGMGGGMGGPGGGF
jgi:hypothetical protein